MMSENNLEELENLYAALSDQTRLRLLNLMREEEICVCFFTESLGESQPKISRHLAYLRKAGLVETRREGKWMHYRLSPPENPFARRIFFETLAWLESIDEMQREYENLIDACCSKEVPVTIARAPKPEAIVESNTEIPAPREELETFLL